MKTQIGKMRDYVRVERCDSVRSDDGGFSEIWTERFSTWARITPLTANETVVSSQVTTNVTVIIRIRYNPDLSQKDRIVAGNRTFYIDGIINIEDAERFHDLLCFTKDT